VPAFENTPLCVIVSHRVPVSRAGGPQAQLLIAQHDARRRQQIKLRRYPDGDEGYKRSLPSAAVISTATDGPPGSRETQLQTLKTSRGDHRSPLRFQTPKWS
jgi:hypothetical protein